MKSRNALTKPLTDAELDTLKAFLARMPGGFGLERLDGFFAALIAGPALIMPSEYLPVIWGREGLPEDAFESEEDVQAFLQLLIRHWNSISDSLDRDGIHLPLVFERDDRRPVGEDWARGFMDGVNMRRSSWAELILDEDEGGAILPMAVMSGEVEPKWPKSRLSEKKQNDMLALMGAGLARIYQYYQAERREAARAQASRRTAPKTGRNEPCPCGSGKKFKLCCGARGGGAE